MKQMHGTVHTQKNKDARHEDHVLSMQYPPASLQLQRPTNLLIVETKIVDAMQLNWFAILKQLVALDLQFA